MIDVTSGWVGGPDSGRDVPGIKKNDRPTDAHEKMTAQKMSAAAVTGLSNGQSSSHARHDALYETACSLFPRLNGHMIANLFDGR